MTAPAYAPQTMTADEFERYALRDENANNILEFIDGEIFVVPSKPFASKISMRIGTSRTRAMACSTVARSL